MKRKTDDAHRPVTRDELESVFNELLERFVEADRHVSEDERHEARTLFIAERCVKTVLDLLKLPADAELLRVWKVKTYDLGPVVEDGNRECVATNNNRQKVLDNIARTHEVWRKAVKEFGGLA